MVWLNYEFAWGGTYQSYYKEQSLNDIIIKDYELQPIKFQSQSLDIETGLHYNRFRYYDSDVGMFIQRDPIGLLGGLNTFQYAPNPILWVDPWGLSCTKPSPWTKKGWKHIYERHIRATRPKWGHKSKFFGDEKSIKKLIEKTIKKGKKTTDGQQHGRVKYTLNSTKPVGKRYDKNKNEYEMQSEITVILDKYGKIVTAFPSNPD
ncbi:RHS repeat-associated core domain-containing protein [Streptococcus suis]|nr:RHS repeat-associated core domain-containing protein [Streptococcus suis]NQJ77721.1 RHS repeat-associated core domain-containing protein [Streptococcus suis]